MAEGWELGREEEVVMSGESRVENKTVLFFI